MIVHACRYTSIVAVCALSSIAGCGGSSTSAEQTGFFSLGVSDGPIDADKVCIAFTGVELKGKGAPMMVDVGDLEVPDDVVTINLLDVPGDTVAPLLLDVELPAGEYQWLRLAVNADKDGPRATDDDPLGAVCMGDVSYVVLPDGSVHNLYIPSGAESGLKFNNGITIPVTVPVAYTAEFDLMLSMRDPMVLGEDVKMRPTVRLVNNIEVGTLVGDVNGDLVAACSDPVDPADLPFPMVFVFNDTVVPNAIEAADAPVDPEDPIATAKVEELQNGDGSMSYDYTVGFLPGGEYVAAFTCDGTEFQPPEGKRVSINAGEVTAVPFP